MICSTAIAPYNKEDLLQSYIVTQPETFEKGNKYNVIISFVKV